LNTKVASIIRLCITLLLSNLSSKVKLAAANFVTEPRIKQTPALKTESAACHIDGLEIQL